MKTNLVLLMLLFVSNVFGQTTVEGVQRRAEAGDVDAQWIYANYLLKGQYVEKDSMEALYWLYTAAKTDMSNSKVVNKLIELANINFDYQYKALWCLGNLYFEKYDYSKAEHYLKKAVNAGSIEAMGDLGLMYYYIDGWNESLIASADPAKENAISEAYKKNNSRTSNDNTAYWLEKIVALDDGAVGYNWYLYCVYCDDHFGIPKNYDRALECLEAYLASCGSMTMNGPEEDSLRLADLYYFSGRNYTKALDIYKTYSNDSWGACGAGRCYYSGKGVNKNYKIAYSYFKKAAENKLFPDAEAMRFLSRCYRYGRGVQQNEGLAEYWHKKALEKKDVECIKLQELLE